MGFELKTHNAKRIAMLRHPYFYLSIFGSLYDNISLSCYTLQYHRVPDTAATSPSFHGGADIIAICRVLYSREKT